VNHQTNELRTTIEERQSRVKKVKKLFEDILLERAGNLPLRIIPTYNGFSYESITDIDESDEEGTIHFGKFTIEVDSRTIRISYGDVYLADPAYRRIMLSFLSFLNSYSISSFQLLKNNCVSSYFSIRTDDLYELDLKSIEKILESSEKIIYEDYQSVKIYLEIIAKNGIFDSGWWSQLQENYLDEEICEKSWNTDMTLEHLRKTSGMRFSNDLNNLLEFPAKLWIDDVYELEATPALPGFYILRIFKKDKKIEPAFTYAALSKINEFALWFTSRGLLPHISFYYPNAHLCFKGVFPAESIEKAINSVMKTKGGLEKPAYAFLVKQIIDAGTGNYLPNS